MIVAPLSQSYLRAALARAARPDEDVITDREVASEALLRGFPRVFVREQGRAERGSIFPLRSAPVGGVVTVVLREEMLASWEAARRAESVLPDRVDYTARRLRSLLRSEEPPPGWVDRTLAELGRASGAALPAAARGMARRVMEFPSLYDDMHALVGLTGLSRGALKARFRRRELPSPYTYLRWFRVLAAAEVLSDPAVTTTQAAHRLGFTNGGNLCRTLSSVCGRTPTEVRSREARSRLVLELAATLLGPEAREAWSSLDDLFLTRDARAA